MYQASQFFLFFEQIFHKFQLQWNKDILHIFGNFLLKRIKIHPIIEQVINIPGHGSNECYFGRNLVFPKKIQRTESFNFVYELKNSTFEEIDIVVLYGLIYNKNKELWQSDLLEDDFRFVQKIDLSFEDILIPGWKRGLDENAFFSHKVSPKFKILEYQNEKHSVKCMTSKTPNYCILREKKCMMSEEVFVEIFGPQLSDIPMGEERNACYKEMFNHFHHVMTTEIRYTCNFPSIF